MAQLKLSPYALAWGAPPHNVPSNSPEASAYGSDHRNGEFSDRADAD